MNEKSGLGSAARCFRSLSRQIPDIAIKILAEDTIFIGKSDRLLALMVTDFIPGVAKLQSVFPT